MNAIPSSLGVEQRPYEPSMEEILASIRRIIADDHSLPSRGAARDIAPDVSAARNGSDAAESGATEPEVQSVPLRAPVHVLRPEIPVQDTGRADGSSPLPLRTGLPPLGDAPQATATDAAFTPRAHGSIAAPQFATPDGPAARPTSDPLSAGAPYVDTPEPRGHASSEGEDAMVDHDTDHQATSEHAGVSALFSTETDHSVAAAFKTLAATRLADNSDQLLTLAREMIRPLLKTWLDDNLPSMVERMVRSEIERVARGGR